MPRDVRQVILTHLASGGSSRFGEFYLVADVTRESGSSRSAVWEALWSLVGDGLLYLETAGQQSSTDNWQWQLSESGKRAAEGGSWEPRDPDGFMNRLREEVPNLDPDIEMYFREALGAFSARCFLASSVMLGVAAERSFQLMATAFSESDLSGAGQMSKVLTNPGKHHYAQWIEFRKRIEPARSSLPEGVGDSLTFDAIADLIRVTRNEAGHPSGRQIDEDTARIHLTIAPALLKKMDLLSEHFRAKRSISSG